MAVGNILTNVFITVKKQCAPPVIAFDKGKIAPGHIPAFNEGTHAHSPRMFGWINPGIVAYGGQEIDAGYEMFVIKRAFGDVQVVSE